MAKLNLAATKSNLIVLKRQLTFAEEGYDLLEQKRQLLTFELMSRLNRACEAERRVADALKGAFASLREAELDVGSAALDRASLAVRRDHPVNLSSQHTMGIRIPRATAVIEPPGARFGVSGTSANADLAMRRFIEALPLLAELAALENAALRLARELRKTQRRCNSLSKIFIPNYRETIAYITSTIEERERESIVILKKIRNRLAQVVEEKDSAVPA